MLFDFQKEPFYRERIFALVNAIKTEYPDLDLVVRTLYNGWQIKDPYDNWDIFCHGGSYGADDGLFETCGDLVPKNWGDTVEGYLTIEMVLDRLANI